MKPKISLFAMHLAYGGVEKAVCAMANLFIEMGYCVTIYCTYCMPSAPAYKLNEQVEVVYLLSDIPNRKEFKESLASKNIFRILKEGIRSVKILYQKKHRIKRKIKSIHEGIVITTRHEDSIVLSKWGRQNVYKIAQLHHDHEFKSQYVEDFKHKYQGIDCFALLTDQLRDEVQNMLYSAGNHHTVCVTVPNFVNDYPDKISVENKEKLCVAVGRLHKVKGFDRLISIFTLVHQKCPDYSLKIIGDGDEMEHLKKLIKENKMEQAIELTGVKTESEVADLMERAQLYLMTSYSEGLPFVLIEAQSHMLPCVAFDVRVGPRAVINDGIDGYLIEDDNTDAFVQKVVWLLENQNARFQMSHYAYDSGLQFTKGEVSKKWQYVLEKGYECLENGNKN